MLLIHLLTFIFAARLVLAGCAMYDNCGKKSVFGPALPCAVSTAPKTPSDNQANLLTELCGDKFDTVCCSEAQLVAMQTLLKKLDPLVSSCPACRRNFYDFVCEFTCSPHQLDFVEIIKSQPASDTGKEIVTELNQYIDRKYAQAFFDLCKNVKFSATNGYAMDLIGGGATTYEEFLKFMSDEKPMLGGSPFQINIKYDNTLDYTTRGKFSDMHPCDDKDYRCACTDCSLSCPLLPAIAPEQASQAQYWMIPALAVVAVLAYRAHRKHDENRDQQHTEQSHQHTDQSHQHTDQSHQHTDQSHQHTDQAHQHTDQAHQKTQPNTVTSRVFRRIGEVCSRWPFTVISVGLAACIVASLGLMRIQLETSPVGLWVSPNEPALHEYQYFEDKFGEWFRIEQVIVLSTTDEPVLSWPTIKWWFEQEQELRALRNNTLDSICFKPLGETCGIQLFTQYFDGNIAYLNEGNWRQQLGSCANSPVNCLPSFQQPLKPNILFDNDNVLEARAFVVTILVNSRLDDSEHTTAAIGYEHEIQNWAARLDRPGLRVSYSTETSLEEELNRSTTSDVVVILASYMCMFIYAALALGGKVPTRTRDLLRTRFMLGFGGIVIIALSVASLAGIFAYAGLKSTLIIAEVIPFLVLAVGIDNIFLIVNAVSDPTIEDGLNVQDSEDNSELPETSMDYDVRIGDALARIGPLCLLSATLQVAMFLLATRVDMPAVRNFAWYSAGAVLINFVLQVTVFIALLSLDERRIASGRLDVVPWVRASVELSGKNVRSVLNDLFAYTYAPWLFANRGKVLSVFFAWFFILASFLLPRVEQGLDQRIALPRDSYLNEYFNAVYEHLNVGPPLFLVVKDANVTLRTVQKQVCGKFGGCDEFSVANILEQEFRRGNVSTVGSPASSWLDDFLTWLNPSLDQCCRLKKNLDVFCSPHAPERQCETCYANSVYESSMEGLPEGSNFSFFFNQWIEEPSDPCPLGGKAPYATSVHRNADGLIDASYLRLAHRPLQSQRDFIDAFLNSKRIVSEIKRFQPSLDVFAFLPFYIFFVQYEHIQRLTVVLLTSAVALIFACTAVLLKSATCAAVLVATVVSILVDIIGSMAVLGVSLNAVSLVNLVICAGIAVEFTVHLTRQFATSKGDVGLLDVGDSGVRRAHALLSAIGGSILSGITITKVIGIFVLAFTKSKIFEVYYFRVWLSLIVIAGVHSLVLLPVLLSYCGGEEEVEE